MEKLLQSKICDPIHLLKSVVQTTSHGFMLSGSTPKPSRSRTIPSRRSNLYRPTIDRDSRKGVSGAKDWQNNPIDSHKIEIRGSRR